VGCHALRFGVESRQVGTGDVEFDFGHWLAGKACRLGPAGPVLRLLRPVTPTVTPEIDCGAAGLTTSVTLLRLFPNTYTYIGVGLFGDYLLSLYRGGCIPEA
jgi:hypothetical protein